MTSTARLISAFFRSLAIAAMAALGGCIATPLPEYKYGPMDGYPSRVERDGFVVGVRVVLDQEVLDKYFGQNLVALGILPLEVSMQNRSTSQSFLVEKENWSLGSGGSAVTEDQLPSPTARAIVAGGGILGYALAAAAQNTRTSIAISEMQTYTISPGRTFSGFLFYKRPPNKASNDEEIDLEVRAQELTSDRIIDLRIPIKVPGR